MFDRAQVRCPVCRSPVATGVLWAVGDSCPHCQTRLSVAPRHPARVLAGAPAARAVVSAEELPAQSLPLTRSMPPETIVSRWVDAFNARDLAGMLAYVAEDVEFHPLRLTGLSAVYRGHDGMREWFSRLKGPHDDHQIVLSELRAVDAGRVLAVGSLNVEEDGVGAFSGLYRIEGGLIAAANHYLTDPGMIERLGLIP